MSPALRSTACGTNATGSAKHIDTMNVTIPTLTKNDDSFDMRPLASRRPEKRRDGDDDAADDDDDIGIAVVLVQVDGKGRPGCWIGDFQRAAAPDVAVLTFVPVVVTTNRLA
jgi:hypothetical protein